MASNSPRQCCTIGVKHERVLLIYPTFLGNGRLGFTRHLH